jgi:hypothetical protein
MRNVNLWKAGMGTKMSALNLVAWLLAAGICVAPAMPQSPDSSALTPPPA